MDCGDEAAGSTGPEFYGNPVGNQDLAVRSRKFSVKEVPLDRGRISSRLCREIEPMVVIVVSSSPSASEIFDLC